MKEIYGNRDSEYLIEKREEGYLLVDRAGKVVEKLSYTFILRSESNSYWWDYKRDRERLKVIVKGRRREEAELEEFYFPDADLTDYEGKWGVIKTNGEIVIPAEYDFVDPFGLTDNYKVFIGKIVFSHTDIVDNVIQGVKCGVVAPGNRVVVPVQYDWIDEIAENLWAVNLGGTVYFNNDYQEEYWSVKGGKWGVINEKSEQIVPINYDNIMTSWYRVKDLLIVQNGGANFNGDLDYDVYDFRGNRLDSKGIDYKKHIFYRG